MVDDTHNITSDHDNYTHWFMYECTLDLDYSSRRVFLFLMHLLFFMVGLVENCLVVWVNWKRRKSCSRVLFCVLNVSISDLMVVLVMPFYMLEVTIDKVWLWGHFLCKFTHLVYAVNFYSSTFFVACMTLERYLSLSQPESTSWGLPERHRRALMCGGLWALAFLLALIENVHVDLLEFEEPGCFLFPDYSYTMWFNTLSCVALLFQFVGPAVIIITCNVLIARTVGTVANVEGRRDVWLVHVYSLVFVVCWLPYHLVVMLIMVDDMAPHLFSCNTVDIIYFSYSITECLSLFHCVANPILYNFLSKGFQEMLINTLLQRLSSRAPNAQGCTDADRTKRPPKEGRRGSTSSTSHSDVGP
ncbi:G-protein coupled receptor 182 [Brienomyrus brachyistius]|uniref:G-protein coupled receptor 182 n=1 Tax=Brienomyrus brachyistius TaxID=42636 RepID=UPI0020B25B84|nr:G-protein coupled receptor 182 [Brienomyrus brachyistius]